LVCLGRLLCGIRATRFGMGKREIPLTLWVFSSKHALRFGVGW
jgi:hypothetical protein